MLTAAELAPVIERAARRERLRLRRRRMEVRVTTSRIFGAWRLLERVRAACVGRGEAVPAGLGDLKAEVSRELKRLRGLECLLGRLCDAEAARVRDAKARAWMKAQEDV